MSDYIHSDRAYMLNIIAAIIPFIRAFREKKFINSETFFRFLESFSNDEVEIFFQDYISVRELRKQVNMQLNQKFNAVKNAQKENVQKKIDIFEKFIDMKYFDDIESYEMIVNRVRSKIRQTLTNYSQIVFDSTLFIFFIFSIFFMANDLIFAFGFFSSKKPKILPKSKKMKLTVAAMKKKYNDSFRLDHFRSQSFNFATSIS